MTKSTHSALDIANYFILLANQQYVDVGTPEGITNLKLQKILYFAQAAHLAVNDKPLFDEEILAWKFGPVVKSVYEEFRKFGNSPIELSENQKAPAFNDHLVNFLESIWGIYGKFSAYELVNITHAHKPWRLIFDQASDGNAIIPKELIQSYYKGFFSEDNGETE